MKDPAFLFYSSDFLSGTMLMTDEEIGQYIKLLCLQHQKGHLKEKDMLNICKTYNEDIFSKFIKDEEGNYYNERLEYEANKRKAYSESRRNNRKKKEETKTYEEDMKNICNSHEEHMENENININKNIIDNKDNRKRGSKGKKEEEKIHFAEFVSMTNAEYDKLVSTYGKDFVDQCINSLDNYKGSSGKKYKSDYRAILSWVIDKVKQKTQTQRRRNE
ncbi:MAG: hypothetical protein ACLTKT_03225 [Clostridia bacterium]